MLSPGRLWQQLRRDLHRGWRAAYYDYKILPLIDQWSWPFWHESAQTISVHVLIGQEAWRRTAWLLASWFHFTECSWPVVLHDDGTLPDEGRTKLKKLFPAARMISREEADAAVGPGLHAYPFCADYRQTHALALKVFDVPHFAAGERFILFHSDLLFFNYPREILDWAAASADECRFLEDTQERSLITAAEARSELSVKIWPRANSGLCLLTKKAIDLDLCDRALAQTSLPSGQARRIEQTLLMLCAARHGRGGLLPRTYEVSSGRDAAPDAIARRYGSAVRGRFYAEGVARLRNIFFPKEP